ncbi:MAG: cation:proton antiporter [Gemmatimonadetes bacterium]|nr:cation:proton antiporter [Gemmatimonadota bacterium]
MNEAGPGVTRTVALYIASAAASATAFWLIARYGAQLTPGSPALPEAVRAPAYPAPSISLVHVLVALAVIVATARMTGYLFALLKQPRVIGEVLAGLLLGPSALGRIAPGLSDGLFGADTVPSLALLAQVGVVGFMFLVGLDLDTAHLRARTRSAITISHTSVVVPFLLGSLLALFLYPRLGTAGVPFADFALFLGVSMAVTAFPVLARIVTERGLLHTTVGTLALSSAAVGDVAAWCLLGFLTAHAAGGGDTGVDPRAFFVSGAFMAGLLTPRGARVAEPLRRVIGGTSLVLLPVFFALTGLKTRVQLVDGAVAWALCAAILATACIGKMGGGIIASRLTGLGWRDSAAIGALMNTRGLVELVVLNLGLELGIISPTLFAMLVIMAVITTAATMPMLQVIERTRERSFSVPPSLS